MVFIRLFTRYTHDLIHLKQKICSYNTLRADRQTDRQTEGIKHEKVQLHKLNSISLIIMIIWQSLLIIVWFSYVNYSFETYVNCSFETYVNCSFETYVNRSFETYVNYTLRHMLIIINLLKYVIITSCSIYIKIICCKPDDSNMWHFMLCRQLYFLW